MLETPTLEYAHLDRELACSDYHRNYDAFIDNMLSEIYRARRQDPTGLHWQYWESVLTSWEAYVFAAWKEIFVSLGLGFGQYFTMKLQTDLDSRVERFLENAVIPLGYKHSQKSELWGEFRSAARERFRRKGNRESLNAYKERLRGIYRDTSRSQYASSHYQGTEENAPQSCMSNDDTTSRYTNDGTTLQAPTVDKGGDGSLDGPLYPHVPSAELVAGLLLAPEGESTTDLFMMSRRHSAPSVMSFGSEDSVTLR